MNGKRPGMFLTLIVESEHVSSGFGSGSGYGSGVGSGRPGMLKMIVH